MNDEDLEAVIARLERMPPEAWNPPAPPQLKVLPAARPRGRRLSLRPAPAAVCAAALLATGGAAGALLAARGDEATGQVTLEPLERTQSARGSVAVLGGRPARATLTVSGLAPTAGGSFYELWLLGPDGELVSLGSFPVDGAGGARITVPLPVDPEGFRFLDVSREPADGDPGHSGASVLRGRTTGA